MKTSDFVNSWIHPVFSRYVRNAYLQKNRKVERQHPDLFRPVSSELVKAHKQLWERLGVPCTDRWLRLHVNLTGIEDHTFCPEDVFFARIERIMCPTEMANRGIEDKNSLDAFFGKGIFPETIVRYMRGVFYDTDYNWMTDTAVDRILREDQGDLVVKPCLSNGGNGVERARFRDGVYNIQSGILDAARIRQIGGESFAVQRKLVSDAFSSRFNEASANTCRMMTMRCPWNGEVVVLRTMMRLGTADVVVDNMMKGGLCVCIDAKGRFGKYGFDYNGRRFQSHPTSGIQFEGLTHPSYQDMVCTATEIARRMPYYNLLSFDLLPDSTGRVRVVEINATSQGITQLQYDFGGLFGTHSERVVEWCAAHKELDTFKHFRTWY